jgi:hypothetical protein
MDRILVKVDNIAAKKWRFASEEKKDELNNAINTIIKKALDKNEEDFWQFLDRVGKQAEANGLTEKILNKLLNEE